MIKRHYFMTYQTAIVNGSNTQGSVMGTSTSWLPDPVSIHEVMVKHARADLDGQGITVTSFQRVR